jgi:hypothetical protein
LADIKFRDLLMERKQQLVQAGVRDVGLELHPARAQHPASGGRRHISRSAKQDRLSDPGLPEQEQCIPVARRTIKKPCDQPKLEITPDENARRRGVALLLKIYGGHWQRESSPSADARSSMK